MITFPVPPSEIDGIVLKKTSYAADIMWAMHGMAVGQRKADLAIEVLRAKRIADSTSKDPMLAKAARVHSGVVAYGQQLFNLLEGYE